MSTRCGQPRQSASGQFNSAGHLLEPLLLFMPQDWLANAHPGLVVLGEGAFDLIALDLESRRDEVVVYCPSLYHHD